MVKETSLDFPRERGLQALEKLCEAVKVLATGPGRVQERLSEAATWLTAISRNELPGDELRPMLVAIVDTLASSNLLAPLENLDDEDAVDLVERILELQQRLDTSLRADEAAYGLSSPRSPCTVPPSSFARSGPHGASTLRAALRGGVRMMIRCPSTRRSIPTGLTTDPTTWSVVGLNKVSCPECKQVHMWTQSDAYLEGGIGL